MITDKLANLQRTAREQDLTAIEILQLEARRDEIIAEMKAESPEIQDIEGLLVVHQERRRELNKHFAKLEREAKADALKSGEKRIAGGVLQVRETQKVVYQSESSCIAMLLAEMAMENIHPVSAGKMLRLNKSEVVKAYKRGESIARQMMHYVDSVNVALNQEKLMAWEAQHEGGEDRPAPEGRAETTQETPS